MAGVSLVQLAVGLGLNLAGLGAQLGAQLIQGGALNLLIQLRQLPFQIIALGLASLFVYRPVQFLLSLWTM